MACATSIRDAITIARRKHRLCYVVVGKGEYKSHVRITKKQASWLLGRGVITDKPAFSYYINTDNDLYITENV